MNFLVVAFVVVAVAYSVAAEGTVDKVKDANQPAYQASQYPYGYGQYGVDAYNPINRRYADRSAYGSDPWAYDLGAHRLHLSGGIYRPHGYDDYAYGYRPQRNYAYGSAYKYYDDAYKYYDNSASGYVKQQPYNYYAGGYY